MMEIWVQYTLDVSKKKEGVLTLGGWATGEICYKFVPSVRHRHAGSIDATPLQRETPQSYLGKEIRRAVNNITFGAIGDVHQIRLLHSDDFLIVYEIVKLKNRTFEVLRNIFGTENTQQRIGLAIFVRTIPIHLPDALRGQLRELGFLPPQEDENVRNSEANTASLAVAADSPDTSDTDTDTSTADTDASAAAGWPESVAPT